MTTDSTLLVLSGIGIPPYSARGLTQTLAPIAAAASLRRTVNGALVDLSASQFRKYASTITCTDQQAPALDGIWPGAVVVVDCVAELAYALDLVSTAGPEREVVASREEGDWVFYRPRLTMRVTGFEVSRDEWGAAVGWKLDLEEV